MPDLIANGLFDSDDMSPWEWCADNELGEAWGCLEDEEPGFPRTRWLYTHEGALTDENSIFLSDYNMRLTADDGIKQDLPANARGSDDFTFWAQCRPLDRAGGTLYAFVCYRDHTFGYRAFPRSELARLSGPNRLHVPVRDKLIEKVVICVVDAAASWYVDAISLPGVVLPAPEWLHRQVKLERRVSLLEKRVDRLARRAAHAPPPQPGEPLPTGG